MKYPAIKILFTVFIFFFAEIPAQVVIVNADNPITAITKGKLRNVFLGNANAWDNGALIRIADYHSDNDLRKDFSDKFLNISPRKVSMIWIKVTLSGKSIPPKIFRDEKDIIDYVARNEGAIAYVNDASNLPDNVKIVEIE